MLPELESYAERRSQKFRNTVGTAENRRILKTVDNQKLNDGRTDYPSDVEDDFRRVLVFSAECGKCKTPKSKCDREHNGCRAQ